MDFIVLMKRKTSNEISAIFFIEAKKKSIVRVQQVDYIS